MRNYWSHFVGLKWNIPLILKSGIPDDQGFNWRQKNGIRSHNKGKNLKVELCRIKMKLYLASNFGNISCHLLNKCNPPQTDEKNIIRDEFSRLFCFQFQHWFAISNYPWERKISLPKYC